MLSFFELSKKHVPDVDTLPDKKLKSIKYGVVDSGIFAHPE